MKPAYPKPPKTRLVLRVNDRDFEIDFVNHNLGIYYTLDIDCIRYHYFEKRFFEQLKRELKIDLKQMFRGKPYFTDIYTNFNNVVPESIVRNPRTPGQEQGHLSHVPHLPKGHFEDLPASVGPAQVRGHHPT